MAAKLVDGCITAKGGSKVGAEEAVLAEESEVADGSVVTKEVTTGVVVPEATVVVVMLADEKGDTAASWGAIWTVAA